jgi:hypothetical protein
MTHPYLVIIKQVLSLSSANIKIIFGDKNVYTNPWPIFTSHYPIFRFKSFL